MKRYGPSPATGYIVAAILIGFGAIVGGLAVWLLA